MGVSLDYRSMATVPPAIRETIKAEAQQLMPAHNWWCESLNFYEVWEERGLLVGGAKIFLIGYSTDGGGYQEVDPDEDSLMAYRDMSIILEKLAEWSRRYDIAWELDIVGEPIGTIRGGQWDDQLKEYFEGMKDEFSWPDNFDEQVRIISEKYASRW